MTLKYIPWKLTQKQQECNPFEAFDDMMKDFPPENFEGNHRRESLRHLQLQFTWKREFASIYELGS